MSEYSGADNLEVMDCAINYNRYLSSLVRVHSFPNSRILDFGAGIGTFSFPLKNDGFDIDCVEADPSQLKRIMGEGIMGFSDLLEVEDGAYDYIFTLNVLEHIEDDVSILQGLFNKLKPNGVLLIYVPAFQIIFSSMDKAVGHYRRYRLEDLCQLVTQSGFKVQESRYVDSLGFVASLIFKYLGSSDGKLNKRVVSIYDRFIFPLSLIVDYVTKKLFGKNLLIVAIRS